MQLDPHSAELQQDVQDSSSHATLDKQTGAVVPDTDDEDMPAAGPLDELSACPALPSIAAERRQAEGPQGKRQGGLPAAMSVLLPGGSSRFSTRHLKQKVEAKLPISTATPIGLPPTPLLPSAQQ